MKLLRPAILTAFLGALVSCRTPPTEIVLRVETDIDQGPGHTLTDVRVHVAPAGDLAHPVLDMVYSLGVRGMPMLPADLGITPLHNDAERSVLVEVTAISNGTDLFTYRAIAPFEAQHTNLLTVFLANRCTIQANRDMCTPSQTCGREGCETVERMSLPPFDPDAAVDSGPPSDTPTDMGIDTPDVADAIDAMDSIDATDAFDAPDVFDAMDAEDIPDGPPCGAGMQMCNGTCVSTDDVRHCGSCSNDCTALANTASATCSGGQCAITCQSGFGDCDTMVGTGCETRVNTTMNCGACGSTCPSGNLCSLSGSTFMCVTNCGSATMCGSSCVDVTSDPAHCGNCATSCPMPANGVPTCTASTCGVSCDTGYHTCTGTGQCFSNTDITHCGAGCIACPSRAHATSNCATGTCSFTCGTGYADCNGVAGDGCEVALSDVLNCGACGNACPTGQSCVPSGGSFACSATCPAGMPCSPGPCTTGTINCSTGVGMCQVTGNFTAGTTCPGGVCNGSGSCIACTPGASCSTGNPCAPGRIQCTTGMPACVASNAPAGTTCPGGVCNGSGSCVPCVPGSSCIPSVECRTGTISCGTGAPVCMVNGFSSSGSACTGGTCDGSGTCSNCTSGPCFTGNPCEYGFRDCEAGACYPMGFVAAGTSCGTDMVCDGSGNCNSCISGTDCSTECAVQQISCASGSPQCEFVSPQPSGTVCSGPGTCDGMGNCQTTSCVPGASCGFGRGPCSYQQIVCMPDPVCWTFFDLAGTSCMGMPGTCNGAGMCNSGGG